MRLFTKLIDRRIAAYQRQLIETHYQEVENMYRQMRGWRHDYRNHIQTMKVLASSGDLEGIRSYLDRRSWSHLLDVAHRFLWHGNHLRGGSSGC